MAQNNVRLHPLSGNVCSPMVISIYTSGNSFTPTDYLWNTGETSSEIEIVQSGLYTCTITGYVGNSNNQVVHTRSANYNVLAAPQIAPLTDVSVCREDTVRLSAVSGYDNITWSDGTTGLLFEKVMNNPLTPGSPGLDTMSVSYVATVNGVCSGASQKVVLRSVRRPDGVGSFYQGNMNINPTDSIPAGLVLTYLYPVRYSMEFTEIANPSNVITYLTALGNRKAPASILTPGSSYTVLSTPIINNKVYCPGEPSTIGIGTGNRLSASGFTEEEGTKTFRVYNLTGQVLLEKQAEEFNQEWLRDLTPQLLIIHRIGKTTEVTKMQNIRF